MAFYARSFKWLLRGRNHNSQYHCFGKSKKSTLPGGDETMLHSVHIVGIRRLAISDSPVSIC